MQQQISSRWRILAIRASLLTGSLLVLFAILALYNPGRLFFPQKQVAMGQQESDQAPSQAALGAQLLKQQDFGAWSYTAFREEDGQISARVVWNDTSISTLRAYAAANQVLTNQLATNPGELTVEVTFRSWLTPDAFRAWASAANIPYIREILLETRDAQGRRYSSIIVSDSNDPLPQSRLTNELNTNSQQFGPLTVQGVYLARVRIPAQQLPALAADHTIFLADVTANIVLQGLRASGVSDMDHVIVRTYPLVFTAMDRFGLENFR